MLLLIRIKKYICGIIAKTCSVYGSYRNLACIDENGLLHYSNGVEFSLAYYCTQNVTCPEQVYGVFVNRIGSKQEKLAVKSNNGDIYVYDYSKHAFAKTSYSDSDITWLSDYLEENNDNIIYSKAINVSQNLYLLNNSDSSNQEYVYNYYSNNQITSIIDYYDFSIEKTENGWVYTRKYIDDGGSVA